MGKVANRSSSRANGVLVRTTTQARQVPATVAIKVAPNDTSKVLPNAIQ